MIDKPCKECARYRYFTRRVNGHVGWWETCGDNGVSISYARTDHGVYGWPHCGPEGRFFVSTALHSVESSRARAA